MASPYRCCLNCGFPGASHGDAEVECKNYEPGSEAFTRFCEAVCDAVQNAYADSPCFEKDRSIFELLETRLVNAGAALVRARHA